MEQGHASSAFPACISSVSSSSSSSESGKSSCETKPVPLAMVRSFLTYPEIHRGCQGNSGDQTKLSLPNKRISPQAPRNFNWVFVCARVRSTVSERLSFEVVAHLYDAHSNFHHIGSDRCSNNSNHPFNILKPGHYASLCIIMHHYPITPVRLLPCLFSWPLQLLNPHQHPGQSLPAMQRIAYHSGTAAKATQPRTRGMLRHRHQRSWPFFLVKDD